MKQARRLGGVALLLASLLWGAALFSGTDEAGPAARREVAPQAVETPSQRPIRVDVQLALVNVSVIDVYGRSVTGLTKEHFKIFEDGQPQTISQFSSEDVPISIGVIFDSSGSMADKINKSRIAVSQFFRASNPADEYLLISFNDRLNDISGFTRDLAALQNKLNFIEAKGRTSLLDAIYLGLNEMRKAKYSRKALLIISDGGDNYSRYTEKDIKRLVKEADVQIYAVGIYEPLASRDRTPEEFQGPSLLTEVAEMTGGRQFPVEDLKELPDITRKISLELRSLYVLGYSPSNTNSDGKWRKIRVKLVPPRGLPPLQSFSKSGYYAPAQ
jgi:Ca-activated chloride channel family protein